MATPPDFSVGQVLTAAHMNAVGLFLVKTQAVGTPGTSITISDVFSSDYDNYKIVVSGIKTTTSSGPLTLLLGTGAGNNYYGSFYYDAYNATATGTERFNNAASIRIGYAESSLGENWTTLEIGAPNLARSTSLSGSYYGLTYSGWFSGTRADTTQYTAFRIQCTQSMTGGTIRVYGYRN